MVLKLLLHNASLHHTLLLAPNLHQHPDAPVWGDGLDRSDKIRERAAGHAHPITGFQQLWRQQRSSVNQSHKRARASIVRTALMSLFYVTADKFVPKTKFVGAAISSILTTPFRKIVPSAPSCTNIPPASSSRRKSRSSIEDIPGISI